MSENVHARSPSAVVNLASSSSYCSRHWLQSDPCAAGLAPTNGQIYFTLASGQTSRARAPVFTAVAGDADSKSSGPGPGRLDVTLLQLEGQVQLEVACGTGDASATASCTGQNTVPTRKLNTDEAPVFF